MKKIFAKIIIREFDVKKNQNPIRDKRERPFS